MHIFVKKQLLILLSFFIVIEIFSKSQIIKELARQKTRVHSDF